MAVPQVDTEYEKEIKKAEEKLKNLMSSEFRAADLLRLAYASQFSIFNSRDDNAGTSADATDTKATQSANNKTLKTETGSTTSGDATTTKTTPSANNTKLKTAIAKIKEESHPTVTFPDLYQLAGTVAVKALGGPIIQFVPGRTDSSISPDEGCLPYVKKRQPDLKDVFRKVGITDPKHIVALCGGLNLARSQDPNLKFDNSYFVNLDKNTTSRPTGNALLDDPDFYSFVKLYAKDKEAFIKAYKEAHKNLSDLGLPQSALEKSTSLWNNMVGQKGAGVAVAAVVVLLSVFYLIINKRRAKHSSQQFQ